MHRTTDSVIRVVPSGLTVCGSLLSALQLKKNEVLEKIFASIVSCLAFNADISLCLSINNGPRKCHILLDITRFEDLVKVRMRKRTLSVSVHSYMCVHWGENYLFILVK